MALNLFMKKCNFDKSWVSVLNLGFFSVSIFLEFLSRTVKITFINPQEIHPKFKPPLDQHHLFQISLFRLLWSFHQNKHKRSKCPYHAIHPSFAYFVNKNNPRPHPFRPLSQVLHLQRMLHANPYQAALAAAANENDGLMGSGRSSGNRGGTSCLSDSSAYDSADSTASKVRRTGLVFISFLVLFSYSTFQLFSFSLFTVSKLSLSVFVCLLNFA